MIEPSTQREYEVWQACDQLVGEGHDGATLTGEMIINALSVLGYAKGSPNQLYQYRTSWRKARGVVIPEPSERFKEVAGSDPIFKAVSHVRNELKAQAEHEITTIREECEQRLARLRESKAKAEEELSLFKIQTQEAHDRYQTLEVTHRDLVQQLKELSTRTQDAIAQACREHEAHERLKEHHIQEIASLRDVYTHMETSFKKIIDDYKTEKEAQHQDQRIEQKNAQLAHEQLFKHHTRLEQQLAHEKAAHQTTVQALEHSDQEKKVLEDRIQDLASAKAEERQQIALLQQQLQQYEERSTVLENEQNAWKPLIQGLTQEIEAQRKHFEALVVVKPAKRMKKKGQGD